MQSTNRELALLVILGLFIIAGLTQREVRQASSRVFRATVHWKVLSYLLGYLAVMISLSQLIVWIGIWSWNQSTTLVIWIIFTGFPIIMSVIQIGDKEDLFEQHFRSVIGLSAFISLVLELRSFNLPIELILLVMLIFASLGEATTKMNPQQYKDLPTGCWSVPILAISAVMLANSLVWLISDASVNDITDIVASFATSVVWTLGSLAVLWVMSIVSTYELAFNRVDWGVRGSSRSTRAGKWALLLGIRLDLHILAKFVAPWPNKLATANSFAESKLVVKEFQQSVHDRRRKRDRYRNKLVANAGVKGTDENGYCLDLRQFKETMRMLDRLWTFHSGQYHAEKRFRSEVVDMLAHGWGSDDLPFPYGIEQVISDNGQSFYAYRRTVSGWYFGVAGKAHENRVRDEYYYDGAVPPQSLESGDWDTDRGGPNSLHWGLNFWDQDLLSTLARD